MTLPSLATLLLCLFAAVLLAVRPPPRARGASVVTLAFAGGVAIALLLRPGVAIMALSAGIMSAVSLLRALPVRVSQVLAGACAGFALAGLFPVFGFGLTALPVWLAGLAALVTGLRFKARDDGFAPSWLVDQGQCAVVIAAPVIAALPGAGEGWRSALALAGAQSSTTGGDSPGMWLLLPLAALAAGMIHQTWKRR